ncbi:hypothetical protein [Agathobaculum desmolans]|uniref:hypothetical protein n=1 Tax=Agathobaculum desmolans TaxID=39484 RepID=UPI00248E51CD|nr:hypothetical protein [Agathobaculum desmolans]
MIWLQRLLLAAFVLFAGLTVFQQMRYGMICGRAEGEDKQADPKAIACRRRAVGCAIAAGASLVLNILAGAIGTI